MKQTLTADFGDFAATRTTARPYTHAWRVTTADGRTVDVGFSQSKTAAEKAAASARNLLTKCRDPATKAAYQIAGFDVISI